MDKNELMNLKNKIQSFFPPWPNNKGKIKKINTIWGNVIHWEITDEILEICEGAPHKLLVFQKIKIIEQEKIEFRIGYYMIGVKKRTKGRWVWGQYCPMVPSSNLTSLIKKAKDRNWF